MKQYRGFSLIELMIVVAIIAILAAVAYPSYQQYIRESRRTDAKDALTRIASAQERYFFTHNSYTDDLADLGMTVQSNEGYYNLAIDEDIECVVGGNTFPCFTATAEPVGPQARDAECAQLRITQTGNKTALNSSDVDTTEECW